MNATQFKKLKGSKKIIMLTCYDFSFASALEEAGVDALLVGDSLVMWFKARRPLYR